MNGIELNTNAGASHPGISLFIICISEYSFEIFASFSCSRDRYRQTGRQTSESIFQITPRTTDPFQLPEYGVCPVGGNGVKNPYVPVVFRYVEILNNHVL